MVVGKLAGEAGKDHALDSVVGRGSAWLGAEHRLEGDRHLHTRVAQVA